MKKIRYSFLFFVLLVGSACSAQTISTYKSAVVHSKFRTATTDPNAAANSSQAQININYLDGLGRGEQGIGYKQSPLQKDLVQRTQIYDTYGRVIRQTLPSVAPTDNGSFQGNAQSLANTFYGDNNAFTETTLFDNSPLNRTREQYGAGQAWRTGNKKTQVFYESAGNTVRRYVVDASGNINLSGTYPKGVLLKTQVVDEQGHTTVEIKDRLDRVVEKWVQDDSGFMITHYVFDSFRRLRAIIQPQGYVLNSGFTKNSTNYQNYVFAYEYDNENRIGQKHIPGGGWTSFVYDKADRPVLEQTEYQAQSNKWSFTKYDVFGRVIITGELTNGNSRATLQTAFEAVANPYETWNGSSYTNQSYPIGHNTTDIRQTNYYDTYSGWQPSGLGFQAVGAYNASSHYANATGLLTGSKTRDPENLNDVFFSVLHYDNKGRILQVYQTHLKGGSARSQNPLRTDYEYNFVGEVLKEKTSYKIDGLPDTETLTTNEYDHVGRILKVFHSINGASGQELCRYGYDEIGRLVQKTILPNGTYLYGGVPDYITREISPNANIDDLAKKAVTILPNTEISTTYSAMIDPNAANGTSINGLQTIDYSYHIRGMLRGVNLDGSGNSATTTPNASQGDLFSFKLDYETANFYDGNIGKQEWRSDTETNRNYTYTYDDAKRLKSAAYTGVGSEDYSLPQITYDKNGNITLLQRKGENNGNYQLIDNLTYAYQGNQLAGVRDVVTGNTDVGDFRDNGSFNDYTYHPDGSLKSDGNKGISLIEYDTFLKKVKQVNWTDGRWLKFFYDGSGTLLKRENSLGDYWEYVGNMIFRNGQFYQMSTPDGRAVYNSLSSQWEYEFEYRDHQNNLRVAFKAENGQLVKTQTSTQDPWGLEIQGLSSITGVSPQNFRFQNQEKINDFGLNWNFYKYRFADAQLGRFFQTDPLSESYVHNSTFAFSENKVINHIELEGLEAVKADYSIKQIPRNNNVKKSTISHQINGYAGAIYGDEISILKVGFGISMNAGALKISSTDEGTNIESSAGLSFLYAGFGYSYEGRENLIGVKEGQRQFTDEQEFSVPFLTYKKIKKSTTDKKLNLISQTNETDLVLGESTIKFFKGVGFSGEVGVRISGTSGGEPKTNILEDMVSKSDNTNNKAAYKLLKNDNNN
jgi:RHS repeat-associated protein